MAGIVEGKSLEESIDMGQWLAKLSIKELGPQYVLPKPARLLKDASAALFTHKKDAAY